MNNTIAVKTEGLKKHFGKIKALDGINLEVRKGTVMALLGPNGAGKTTFIRILATLMKPDAGWAKVSGYDVVQEAAKVRSVIGLTGQYASVDENLTGAENLEMVGQLYHLRKVEARSRAYELLDVFDLMDAARRRVRTYSGGMRRRLDLAASLVARPPILFLDEPTAGLDPRSRLGLWDIITDLVQEGTTVFLTTQYLEEADRLADGIAVLDNGIIIKVGTSLELKGCCGGDVLVQLSLADRAQLQTAAEILDDLGDGRLRVIDEIGHITLPLSGGTYMLPEIIRRLDTGHVVISDLSVRQPTLDDVFLALTGRSTEESTDIINATTVT
ncbi:MAG: ATP-binding cassette domain-containing protein [Dehalococcoidia bacterium]|nr:MAG: ATP-binding cassette domain-containing protein [Dehalococcoidia bacterium]